MLGPGEGVNELHKGIISEGVASACATWIQILVTTWDFGPVLPDFFFKTPRAQIFMWNFLIFRSWQLIPVFEKYFIGETELVQAKDGFSLDPLP